MSKHKTKALLAVACIFVVGVSGAVYIQYFQDDTYKPTYGAEQTPAPALAADPLHGTITAQATGASISVDVEAPAGVDEMQIGFDPTFSTVSWQPIAEQVLLQSAHDGYQTIYARFRAAAEPPSTVLVTDVVIESQPTNWVAAFSDSTLIVHLEPEKFIWGQQESYDFSNPPEGDKIGTASPEKLQGDTLKTVTKDGTAYAMQTTGNAATVKTYDRLVDDSGNTLEKNLDLSELSWTLTNEDTTPLTIVSTIRRSVGSGKSAEGNINALSYDAVLQLDEPLQEGETYILATTDQRFSLSFSPDFTSSYTPVIQTNQAGYAPNDPLKVAYLGGWFEDINGLDYSTIQEFQVLETKNNTVAITGSPTLRNTQYEIDKNVPLGAPVYELNFSDLTTPGAYKICIDRLGCSYEFTLDASNWLHPTSSIARAAYLQRSGIALGPPYTSIQRPRPRHKDDGAVAYQSTYSHLEGKEVPPGDVFGKLVASATQTELAAISGGHHDAGDWDRRIDHLYYSRDAADLLYSYPEMYENLSLNVPESTNAIPDIIDDGIWTLDFYRNLQRSDGAVSGGIEASEHPMPGDSSWTDKLALYAFEPDPHASYLYAGVAAEYAKLLQKYDPDLATLYEKSALAAINWAEKQPLAASEKQRKLVAEQRLVAAAALFVLTEDEQWHQVVKTESIFAQESTNRIACHARALCDTGWIYLRADAAKQDPTIKANIVESFLRSADDLETITQTTQYGWATEHRDVPLIWGLGAGGTPKSVALLKAYQLSGNTNYLEAVLRTVSNTLGANPIHTSFITGVGKNPVRHPLVVDNANGGLPVWPGTPIFGHHWLNHDGNDGDTWVYKYVLQGLEPSPENLPYLWQWQDASIPFFTEYTLHQSHAPSLLILGSLAAENYVE